MKKLIFVFIICLLILPVLVFADEVNYIPLFNQDNDVIKKSPVKASVDSVLAVSNTDSLQLITNRGIIVAEITRLNNYKNNLLLRQYEIEKGVKQIDERMDSLNMVYQAILKSEQAAKDD